MAEMTLFLYKKTRGRFFHQQLNNKNSPHLSALRAPVGLEHSNWFWRLASASASQTFPPTTPNVTVKELECIVHLYIFQGLWAIGLNMKQIIEITAPTYLVL